MNSRKINLIIVVMTHFILLLPLIMLVWDYLNNNLTANPVRQIQLRTGDIAINLLMLSLACSPINILTGFTKILVLRRTLGIYAFFYALLHFLNFVGLDYGFNFSLIQTDLFNKRYAIAGLISLLLLIPAAITSIRFVKSWVGKTWQKLNWLVYAAAIAAVIHYIWQTKADVRLPILYGVILALLLIIRLPAIRNFARQHFKWLNRTETRD